MKNAITEKLKRIPKPIIIRCVFIVVTLLVISGVLMIWHMFVPTTIKGIDVSHYQSDINWSALKESGNAKFVYIKATEGKAYRDTNFKKNWDSASLNGIPAGAYHYYSQSSTGTEQANNFIAVVPKSSGKLPPAIDIEDSIVKQADFKFQLAIYVKLITEHYGQKPIFYVPYKIYNSLYDEYKDYTFWVIDYINANPTVQKWTFWQYSEKGYIAGISEKVDLDQYQGSIWNFNNLLSK